MPINPLFLAIAIFALLAAVTGFVYIGAFSDRYLVEERLADIAVKARAALGREEMESRSFARAVLRWAAHFQAGKNTPRSEKLQQTLTYAGFHHPNASSIYQAIRLGIMGALGIAAVAIALASGKPLASAMLWAVAGVIAGLALPNFYIATRATKRQRRIAVELSDILDLLTVCVESGLGIFQAIRTVGRESQSQGRELGRELSILSGEVSAGSTLGQGLRAMAERTGVEDVRGLAAILIQSEKLGSQMAPALRASSDALRNKRRLRAEEAAQKTTIKMLLPLVLFVLPSMMAVVLGPAVIQIFRNFHVFKS